MDKVEYVDVAGNMWQAILFDVGGVFAHQDQAEANHRLAALRADLDTDAIGAALVDPTSYPLWERYSCGRLAPEAYWASVLRVLGVPETIENISTLRAIQADTWWARLDEAVLDIVRQLRTAGRWRLGVLSNSSPEHEKLIGAFAHLFDVAHFSHQTGLRKPWPAAYRAAAVALDVPPEAVVFIDDKQRNLEPAAALGMRALRFQSAASLAASLAELGLTTAADRGAE